MQSSSFDLSSETNNGFEGEIVAKKRGCEEEGTEEGLKALFTRTLNGATVEGGS